MYIRPVSHRPVTVFSSFILSTQQLNKLPQQVSRALIAEPFASASSRFPNTTNQKPACSSRTTLSAPLQTLPTGIFTNTTTTTVTMSLAPALAARGVESFPGTCKIDISAKIEGCSGGVEIITGGKPYEVEREPDCVFITPTPEQGYDKVSRREAPTSLSTRPFRFIIRPHQHAVP